MELIPLIQKLTADASQFNSVFDQAEARMRAFQRQTETLNRQANAASMVGSPGELFAQKQIIELGRERIRVEREWRAAQNAGASASTLSGFENAWRGINMQVDELQRNVRRMGETTRAASADELDLVRGVVNARAQAVASGVQMAQAARAENQLTRDLLGLRQQALRVRSQEEARDRINPLVARQKQMGLDAGVYSPFGQFQHFFLNTLSGSVITTMGSNIKSVLGGAFSFLGGVISGVASAIGNFLQAATIGAVFATIEIGVRSAVEALSLFLRVTTQIGTTIVRLGAELEMSRVAFEVFTGSAEKGRSMLDQIQKLALRTPFDTRQLSSVAQTMLGSGVDEKNVLPALERLGDIAGGDAERLRNLALAFAEVTAEGRLTGQRLRQFAAAGVGIKDFAESMKIGTAEARAQMHAVGIPLNEVYDALNKLTDVGGRFFGMTAKGMQTVHGQWTNLLEALEILAAKIGVGFFERFDIAGKIGGVADWLAGNQGKILAGAEQVLDRIVAGAQVAFTAIKAGWDATLESFGVSGKTFEDMLPSLDAVRSAVTKIIDALITFREMATQVFTVVGKLALTLVVKPLVFVGESVDKIATRMAFNNRLSMLKDEMDAAKAAGDTKTYISKKDEYLITQGQGQAKLLSMDKQSKERADLIANMEKMLNVGNDFYPKMKAKFHEQLGAEFEPGEAKGGWGPGSLNVAGKGIGAWGIPAAFAGEAKGGSPLGLEVRANGPIMGPDGRPPKIVADVTISPEAAQLLGKIKQEFKAGTTPLDRFQRNFNLTEEAFGRLAWKRDDLPAAWRNPNAPGNFDISEEGKFSLFKDYQELAKGVKGPEENLPRSAQRYSQEAQDMINKANLQNETTGQEMLRVLTEANAERENLIKKQDEVIENLRELAKKGFIKK